MIRSIDRYFPRTFATETGAFTAVADRLHFCTLGTSYTATLPPVAQAQGAKVGFKAGVVTGSSAMTVDGNSTETIDGAQSDIVYLEDDYLELYSDGTEWHIVAQEYTPHSARIQRAAAQSIADNTDVRVEFDAEDFDVGNIATLSTGGGVSGFFNIRRAGKYIVSIHGPLAIAQDTRLLARLFLDNVEVLRDVTTNATTGGAPTAGLSETLSLSGDKVEMGLFHTDTGAINTGTSEFSKPAMSIVEQR